MNYDNLSIRPAIPRDLDALTGLESASFSYDQLSRRSFRRFLSSNSAMLWCCYTSDKTSKKLVGYALVLTRKNSRKWRLYSLVVDQQARGQGIAGKLLETVIARATGGLDGLTLEVKKDNLAAIALYRRYGFNVVGERDNYYSDGSSAVKMILKFQ